MSQIQASRFRSGCACRGIDVHCHVVPSSFPGAPGGETLAGWPSMTPIENCHATVVINDKPYRTVSDACWLTERRIEEMDRAGIAVQALSPMPELFGYWIDAAAAAILIRHVNDVIAGMVSEGAGRFVGLGGLPLQDIDLAIAELHRVVSELGFRGVEIGSNINGVPIGDPRFHPFFAEAERLGAAVFVHAVRPAGMDRLVGPAPLQQVLAYPTDVGLAAASVITSGLLQKFPSLRIAFSPRLGLDVPVDPDVSACMEAAVERLRGAGLPIERADPSWPQGASEEALMPLQHVGLASLFESR